jgi:hypothetical protein
MKLYDYIPEALLMQRIEEGYVNVNQHKKFPLAIYTYSKSATYDYVWDEATCKCRGLIVDQTTMEIIARPFEKFFNVGEKAGITREQFPDVFPKITDKLDGNLITLYQWKGSWYAASKGSFHSEHADWANNWLSRTRSIDRWTRFLVWPLGYTPVFEMIAEELEHRVVHYGKEASGLYLIALIENETGEELNDVSRIQWADRNDVPYIPVQAMSLDKALTDNEKNAEGYVLAWPRPGQTPLRVKVKFIEFLRLQKLVHNIGPKEILDYMRKPELKCYLDEVLDPERSHEVFIAYTKKWMERFQQFHRCVETTCAIEMDGLLKFYRLEDPRSWWAEKIKQCQYPDVMFAMLDLRLAKTPDDFERCGQNIERIIWRKAEVVAEQVDDVRSIITQEE